VRAKCSSYQPANRTDLMFSVLGKSAVILAASAFLVWPGFSQPPQPSATPQRPLRERLLERALKGDADAQFDLAKGYEGGRFGLTQDYVQASHWYQEAANQGEPFAEASLGLFYGAGKGVKQDYVLAYAWLNRSTSHLTGPERETVMEIRDSIGRRMTAAQREQASHALSDSAKH
jgi:TPR repeat protein